MTRRINKKTLENNADIKVSKLNDNNIVNINCNKGKDTDIDLLISNNLSDMNGNSRENRAAIESECRKVDEINLIDFSEPEINSVEKVKIQERIIATKIAMYFLKLENSLQYIEIENPYTNRICNLLVDSGAQLNIIKEIRYLLIKF